jgi:hypothetical protein
MRTVTILDGYMEDMPPVSDGLYVHMDDVLTAIDFRRRGAEVGAAADFAALRSDIEKGTAP